MGESLRSLERSISVVGARMTSSKRRQRPLQRQLHLNGNWRLDYAPEPCHRRWSLRSTRVKGQGTHLLEHASCLKRAQRLCRHRIIDIEQRNRIPA